jgi:uncharacterized protein (DUF4415 family)
MRRFEWDEAKNRLNKTKHGIDFSIAQLVFDDPFSVWFPDRVEDGEERWHAIGMIDDIIVLAQKRKDLAKLAKMPDSQIDLSDIPEIKNLPSAAVIGKFYRPRKTSVTIRLDADVLAWLKATGDGYQTRVNTYLRQLMQHSVRRLRKAAR